MDIAAKYIEQIKNPDTGCSRTRTPTILHVVEPASNP